MPLYSSDKYAVRFIPRENGIYLIDVKFNGTHIPGSPFKIRVGEPGHGGDPGMVSAYGAGLEGGITGGSAGTALCVAESAMAKLLATTGGASLPRTCTGWLGVGAPGNPA